ncbi:MAG: hypothetical protein JO039_24295 [Solirubrobacterales bacterium]|nr:hypothetical protein [Solirubrobacterales bacterium]
MTDLASVTCAGCGLLCDDVIVDSSGAAVRLRPECSLGAEWFSQRVRRSAGAPAASIRGQPADVEAALSRAADLLRGARRPLVHGFDWATVEDARAAVALADRLGALIVPGGASGPWPGSPAVPLRGASSATLGEIRDRSRLVVIWREDPVSTHPRLLDRLGFGVGATPRVGADATARLGAERRLVVVDDRDTSTAERAELQLRWPRERDLEALTALHARHRKLALRPSDLAAQLDGLLELINVVPHAAFVYGAGLVSGRGGQRRALALHELVRALCHDRHVVTLELPPATGTRSVQDVLAWQTGYPQSVDLLSGHPELVTATRPLETGEGVDVSLRVEGAFTKLPDGATEIALSSLPGGSAGTEPEVSIRTAAPGVEANGTAHRLDGVPLALQAPLRGAGPTAAALLTRLLAEIEA